MQTLVNVFMEEAQNTEIHEMLRHVRIFTVVQVRYDTIRYDTIR